MIFKHTIIKVALYLTLFIYSFSAYADPAIIGQIDKTELLKLKSLLDTPESQINFASSKLAIDQLIKPSLNIPNEMQRLDAIVDKVKMMGDVNSSMAMKNALRQYIYDAGSWNHYQPFKYDFADPKGTNINNKLISNYLTSKKGNCVSMPFLFIILGQKLGLDVSASTAPLHVFVKYTDDASGQTYNLETTSGANPARDSWLRQGFPMTDVAVNNGIYLQKLTKKETVALMANTLLQHYSTNKRYGQVIATSELILHYYPKNVNAVVYLASAYNNLLREHGLWQYRTPQQVPPSQRETFKYLIARTNWYHNVAVQMGWKPPSQAENNAYLKKVEQEAKQGH